MSAALVLAQCLQAAALATGDSESFDTSELISKFGWHRLVLQALAGCQDVVL